MQRTVATITNVFGIAALLLVGYVVVTSIPDVKRYIRMSMM